MSDQLKAENDILKKESADLVRQVQALLAECHQHKTGIVPERLPVGSRKARIEENSESIIPAELITFWYVTPVNRLSGMLFKLRNS